MLETVTGLNEKMKSLPAYWYDGNLLSKGLLPVDVTREQTTYIMEPNGDEREVREQEVVPLGKKRLIQELFTTINAEGSVSVWAAPDIKAEALSFTRCGNRAYYVIIVDAPAGAVPEIQAAMDSETIRRAENIQSNMSEVNTLTQMDNQKSFSTVALDLLRAIKEGSKGDPYINIMMQDFLGEIEGAEEYRLSVMLVVKHDCEGESEYSIEEVQSTLVIPEKVIVEKSQIRRRSGNDMVEFEFVSDQAFTVTSLYGSTLFYQQPNFCGNSAVLYTASRVRICEGY
jgi:hypothetical protein